MPDLKHYYRLWLVGFVFFGVILWLHGRAHFSPVFLDFMILKNSTFKTIEDPCKFQLAGNPILPDRYQVRVNFRCWGGRTALNTLAFTSLRDKTLGGAIKEAARIHGFSSDPISGWECKISGEVVTDWNTPIYQGNWIECYEG